MLHALADQRCFNHAHREAVARCPECGRYFCRECITEYEDRVLCAVCLTKAGAAASKRAVRFAIAKRAVQCVGSIMLLWFIFYVFGLGLVKLPTSFHESTLWKIEDREMPEDTP